jgi:hypothetical protein
MPFAVLYCPTCILNNVPKKEKSKVREKGTKKKKKINEEFRIITVTHGFALITSLINDMGFYIGTVTRPRCTKITHLFRTNVF